MATTALEELENSVNDAVNRLRRATEDKESGGDGNIDNHPKVKELRKRLHTAMEAHRKAMGDEGEGEGGRPAPASRIAATPEDVLSSPYPGSEPRYVKQHDGHPDPIERARPTPPAQAAGRVTEDEPKLDDDAKKPAAAAAAKR